jgi:hypothetical protein
MTMNHPALLYTNHKPSILQVSVDHKPSRLLLYVDHKTPSQFINNRGTRTMNHPALLYTNYKPSELQVHIRGTETIKTTVLCGPLNL